MGYVYRVRDTELKRHVILKVMQPGKWEASLRKAFLREVEITARLDHPNIIRLYDKGEIKGLPFYTMPEVRRETFDQRIQLTHQTFSGQFRFRPLLEQFRIVCGAVGHANEHGIFHCDLKPANIRIGDTGEVVVIDWGLAREPGTVLPPAPPKSSGRGTRRLETTRGFGTLRYMPPEQLATEPPEADSRTDVYALGAILFEILKGRPPFTGTSAEIRARKQDVNPTSALRTRGSGVPRPLASICAKAMHPNPASRYATALELSEDLGCWLAGRPVSAHPESMGERLVRWVSNHRTGVVAAAVTLILVAVVSVASAVLLSLSWRAESGAREEAEERLVRLHTANGQRELQDGYPLQAPPHYAEALRLDSRRQDFHRMRLGSLLRQAPSINIVCAHQAPVVHATFSSDGHWLLTTDAQGLVRVWDAATGERKGELRHNDAVRHGSFSRDGLCVVTASEDRTARLWWWSSGRIVHLSHQQPVQRAWFALDDTKVVTTSGDGFLKTVHGWDAQTGERDRRLVPDLQGEKVLLSPDRRRIAVLTPARSSGLATRQVLVHDMRTRQTRQIELIVAKEELFVTDLCFTPDSEWVMVVGGGRVFARQASSGTPGKFATVDGQPKNATLVPDSKADDLLYDHRPRRDAYSIAVSSDLSRLAVGCRDGQLRLYELAIGYATELPLGRHLETIAFSPDGDSLLTVQGEGSMGPLFSLRHLKGHFTAYSRNEARVWDTRSGMPLTPPLHHCGMIWQASYSPDGRRLLTVGDDGAVVVWRPASLAGSTHSFRLPPPHSRTSLAEAVFAPDGGALLTLVRPAGDTQRAPPASDAVHLYTLQQAEGTSLTLRKDEDARQVEFAANGRYVVVIGSSVAKVYDRQSGALVASLDHPGKELCWGGVDRQGQRVATLSEGVVSVWDFGMGRPRCWKPEVSAGQILLSPEGHHVLVVGREGKLRLYNIDGQPVSRALAWPTMDRKFAFSPDGVRLLAFGNSNRATLLDPVSGTQYTLQHSREVFAAVFSPDGRWVATGSQDGTTRVWDSNSGEPCSQPLIHCGLVSGVRFSRDSRRLATILSECDVQVWDRVTGEALTAPFHHPGVLKDLFFSLTGDELVTVCQLGHTSEGLRVTAWDLSPDRRPVEELARHAALLAGFEIDAGGNRRLLDGPQRRRLWEQIQDTSRAATRARGRLHLGTTRCACP
jgi:WD40 repeat protein